ncbi:hypothetical protein BGZ94_009506 [Podila epigama]|nr:hypothetical protein BGZ94_009506 [Podila epigama]
MQQTFLDWALQLNGKEHVSLPELVRHFGLLNRDVSTKTFEEIVKSTQIPQKRQAAIQAAHKYFKEHHEETFWAHHAVKYNARMTRKRVAIAIQNAGLQAAEASYLRTHTWHPFEIFATVATKAMAKMATVTHRMITIQDSIILHRCILSTTIHTNNNHTNISNTIINKNSTSIHSNSNSNSTRTTNPHRTILRTPHPTIAAHTVVTKVIIMHNTIHTRLHTTIGIIISLIILNSTRNTTHTQTQTNITIVKTSVSLRPIS